MGGRALYLWESQPKPQLFTALNVGKCAPIGLGALFLNLLIMASVGVVHLSDALHVHARMCAYVGLFAGCRAIDVVQVSGLTTRYVWQLLSECVELGYISRSRIGRFFIYRLLKSGRKFLSHEQQRVNEGVRLVLDRARLVPCARLELIAQLEDGLG